VPKLWDQTIEEHRRSVHAAILDTTAALVAEHGLAAVTMSRIAQATGIGRATLYKYFADVEAIMVAWHERQIATHLQQLTDAAHGVTEPVERLRTVLHTYATLSSGHHGHELAAVLHRGDHITHARRHLADFVTGLIADAVAAGDVRSDIEPAELAAYCLHAMAAAADVPPAGKERLVTVTMAGLRPHATP
jgi:AcrR family transcriptional regulator